MTENIKNFSLPSASPDFDQILSNIKSLNTNDIDQMSDYNSNISNGTTIIAMKYSGGVLLAADSRTSSMPFIPSKTSYKIRKIAENVFTCQAGTASHSQYLVDIVKAKIGELSLFLEDKNVPPISVTTQIKNYLFKYKDFLSCAFLVGGFNHEKNEGEVYQINMGGSVFSESDFYSIGSGSIFVTSHADKFFKKNMEENEGIEFLKNCIRLAAKYDAASGGIVRIFKIDKIGFEEFIFEMNE